MRLPGMIHPLAIVPVSLHIAHRPKRRLKCVVDLYFCGPGKLPDVPSRIPGADDEQPLAGRVQLPLQFRPLRGLGRGVRVEVHCHPVGIHAVEKQDRWAESLRVSLLACPVQPEVGQDRRDTRADETADQSAPVHLASVLVPGRRSLAFSNHHPFGICGRMERTAGGACRWWGRAGR